MFNAPVAQLDRALDFESIGRRFESYRARNLIHNVQIENKLIKLQKGPLAQLAEQIPLKDKVTGSIPVRPTTRYK